MSSDVVKCTAQVSKVLFPKTPIQNGDFGIVSMKLVSTEQGQVEVDPKYGNFIVKGTFCRLNGEDEYVLTMKPIIDKKWGRQYELIFLRTKAKLDTVEQQKEFLRVSLTDRLVEALYETISEPMKALELKDMEALCSVKGIKEKTARKLIERYESTKDEAEVHVKLKDYDLSTKTIKKLMKKYGSVETILDKLHENIYILAADIDGIGFKKADEVALKFGMEYNDPRRIQSFILHYLNSEASEGNSWVYVDDMLNALSDTCGEIDSDMFKAFLLDLEANDVTVSNKSKTIVGLRRIFEMEMEILQNLERIAEGENNFEYGDWEEVVNEIEEAQGWKYTSQQRAGVKTVLDNQVVLVTGLAGTGKTTVTNAMSKVLKNKGYKILQMALSGRASQRMKELNGITSYTIHKGVGIKFGSQALHHEGNPIDADVILLDEASMPDARMYLVLLKAIRTGSKLIIIGDKGQLPSIGIANIFFDLLEYKYPVVELTQVHRQAQASAIISESIRLRKQVQLFSSSFTGETVLGELQDLEMNIFKERGEIHGQVVRQFLKQYEKHNYDVMKVQIIAPMRTRGDISAKAINESIQARINVNVDMDNFMMTNIGYCIYVGDKVINNTNAKARTTSGTSVDIFNGNMGIVKSINTSEGSMVVYFTDLDEEVVLEKLHVKESIDLAYAVTCHKLQGSSCDTVIVCLDFSAYTMLCCEYVYTAITRAEKYCILIAENNAVRFAISRTQSANKQTFIKVKAQQLLRQVQ